MLEASFVASSLPTDQRPQMAFQPGRMRATEATNTGRTILTSKLRLYSILLRHQSISDTRGALR